MDTLIQRKNHLKGRISTTKNLIKRNLTQTTNVVKNGFTSSLLKAGASTLALGAVNKAVIPQLTHSSKKSWILSLAKYLPIAIKLYKKLK